MPIAELKFFSMKFLTFLVVILAQSHGLAAQQYNRVYFDSNWILTSIEKATYCRESGFDASKPSYDGKVSDCYLSNGIIEMEGTYESGLRNGQFKFSFSDGKAWMILNYQMSERVGVWSEFYQNGIVKVKIEYVGGVERVLELNDSLGAPILINDKFRYTQYFFDESSDKKALYSERDEFKISGSFANNLRNGNWMIKRDGTNFASLKYENGILIKGVYLKDNQKTPILNNLVFPLIMDPFKFRVTELFKSEPGAVIKNNFVTEGLHQYKFRSMKKATIGKYDDFVKYINDHLELRSTQGRKKLTINFIIADGIISDFKTDQPLSTSLKEDVKLVCSTIEKITFTTNGTVRMEYVINPK